jgi:uncharacterized RDD family membrane protein YckC
LAAHFCDVAIPIFALFAMLGLVGAGAASGSSRGAGAGALTAVVLMVVYVVWALQLFARGMTPGKKLLGIRVIKESGAAAGFGAMLLREWIGKWISALIFSLGFLWILIDRDRQGWHDKLGSTFVIQG